MSDVFLDFHFQLACLVLRLVYDTITSYSNTA